MSNFLTCLRGKKETDTETEGKFIYIYTLCGDISRLICDIQVSSKSERAGLHFYENDREKLCNDLSDFLFVLCFFASFCENKENRAKRFCIIKFVSLKRSKK